uniref:RNA helicase n=2 Tax=Photinus pyralis TaxID=7054 RepID=A0A1Y1LTH7_PHOPY
MDSKFNLLFKHSNNVQPFQMKRKPSPVVFNNGSPPRKRLALNINVNSNNFVSKNKLSIQEQRRKLPIFEKRNKLLELIRRHNTLIILGETGSGKTTQIPQYINSARLQNNGKIAITQPRRVAAISVAMRVAQEIGDSGGVGETVGYTVRFEDVTSPRTKIKYLTDGMLLREAMVDNLLMEYTFVILDEAHERTIHTDVLFGIVKQAQKARAEKKLRPLKILIMSATMDVDHFSEYFNNCQAVYLEGRTYPVNVYYTLTSHEDYQTACVATFFKIHRQAPWDHDVLIFLTGQEEIEAVAQQIRILSRDPDVSGPSVKVCPLYASQPTTQQITVFQPAPENTRKVVIATNVAETSITISGIRFVIDGGMVKARTYHPATGLDMLKVQRISQEQSWQRTGRAGREAEGYCYRIYTRAQYELLQKSTIPEIQRANLSTVVIQLLALGIHAANFDFMDKPPKDCVLAAFEQLKLLGAVESVESSSLTPLGKKMVQFPLDPRFSKVILSAQEYECLEEILTIVALLSGEAIFLNPSSKREQATTSRQKFLSPYGDHITLLNAFRVYRNLGSNSQRSWCHEHYINMRNISYAAQVRTQLLEVCQRLKLPVVSCGNDVEPIRKCLLTGLFMNVAELHKEKQYITLDKRQVVNIHPSSVIHGQQPKFVLFTEVVQTSKCYLRGLTTVESQWLYDIVPDYARSHIRLNKDL